MLSPCLFVLSLLVSLEALQDPAPVRQDDVTIRERKDPSATAPSLEEAARRLQAVPGGVNLLDADEYRRGRAAQLEDVFALTPGVFAASRFGYEEARISIRGSGLQRTFHGRGIRVLQDGIPINLADGSFDMQQLEPLAARYVEVHRGANALQFGSTTLGGAIHFVSRSGHDASPLLLRAEAGSFGYFRNQIAAGGVFGDLDAYASLTNLEADGFRHHADQENVRFFGNLGWRLSDAAESRLYFTYVQTDSELPGSLTKAQMRRDPRQANPLNVAGDWKRDFTFFRLADRTTWTLGDARVDASLGYTRKHLDHPIFQVIDQVNDDVVFNAAYTSEAPWFGRKNRFVAGIFAAYGLTDEHRYVNVGGNTGAKTADQDLTAASVELFAQEQLELAPGLFAVAGFQAVWTKLELEDDFLANGDQTDEDRFRAFNPKLGLLWELDAHTQVFINGSRSFETPSFGEVANNAAGGLLFPDAQAAWTLEIGTRGKAGVLAWDLAAYHAWVDDELLALIDPVTSAPLGTINADKTVHRGAEAGVDLTVWEGAPQDAQTRSGPADRVVVRSAYLFNDFRFKGDAAFGNNVIAGIPRHVLHAELRLESRCGFALAPNLNYVPTRMYIDHANTFQNSAFAVWGVRASYAYGKLSFFVDARNLTNRVYSGTTGVIADANGTDQAQFLPSDGRSVYGGLEFTW